MQIFYTISLLFTLVLPITVTQAAPKAALSARDSVEWHTLGTWKDSKNKRIFPVRVLSSKKAQKAMTRQKCFDECGKKNLEYAGLEFGKQCFCASSAPGDKQEEPVKYLSCTGAANETCGAAGYLEVFKRFKDIIPQTKTPHDADASHSAFPTAETVPIPASVEPSRSLPQPAMSVKQAQSAGTDAPTGLPSDSIMTNPVSVSSGLLGQPSVASIIPPPIQSSGAGPSPHASTSVATSTQAVGPTR